MRALRNIFKNCGLVVDLWIFALVTFFVFVPIAWVRTVERFQVGYLYSCIVILAMIIVVGYFVSANIADHDGEAGREWQ